MRRYTPRQARDAVAPLHTLVITRGLVRNPSLWLGVPVTGRALYGPTPYLSYWDGTFVCADIVPGFQYHARQLLTRIFFGGSGQGARVLSYLEAIDTYA